MTHLDRRHLNFLTNLGNNNNRDWFKEHKDEFDEIFADVKKVFQNIYENMQQSDDLQPIHIHRIYRNLQFSKDKTPYKTHFSLHIGRTKPLLRGGYFLNIEPGNSFAAGGFWRPDNADLMRFRKEIAFDDKPLRHILAQPDLVKYFGMLEGEALKSAPAGFSKDAPGLDLLQKKQWLLRRKMTDHEVCHEKFADEVTRTFLALRPFFDYMSEVLTSDENGVSLFGS